VCGGCVCGCWWGFVWVFWRGGVGGGGGWGGGGGGEGVGGCIRVLQEQNLLAY